jgi:hypothetical protein
MKIDYTEITVKLMKDYTAKYLQENAELVQDTIKATQEALAISLPLDTDGCSNDRDKCSCKNWGGCPVN